MIMLLQFSMKQAINSTQYFLDNMVVQIKHDVLQTINSL